MEPEAQSPAELKQKGVIQMSISIVRAIVKLLEIGYTAPPNEDPEAAQACLLGVQALKRIQLARQVQAQSKIYLLPGETNE